jgi:hypothetical protein
MIHRINTLDSQLGPEQQQHWPVLPPLRLFTSFASLRREPCEYADADDRCEYVDADDDVDPGPCPSEEDEADPCPCPCEEIAGGECDAAKSSIW